MADDHGADRPASDAAARAELERTVGALRDPTRRSIMLSLLGDRTPRTVDEIAGMAGVHRTVAFGHLERLVDLGFLEKGKRRSGVGKPAALYAPGSSPLLLQYPARQFIVLAGLLASALGSLGDAGIGVARDVGRRFGEGSAPRGRGSVPEALDAIGFLGAEHAADGDEIVAANCVFLEACTESPHVVCALHAGILEGALSNAGISARVEARGPVPPAGCAFRVVRG